MSFRQKRPVYIAALITLIGMGGLGVFLMMYFHQVSIASILSDWPENIWVQLSVGLAYGYLSTQVMLLMLRRRVMSAARHFFGNILQKYQIGWPEIILVSLCAGIGEELLFRGAIQPWLGIWTTALVFIGLHGYLDPRDKPVFLYGLAMVIVSAGFGYLTTRLGIWSAAAAHALIDILLMAYLKKQASHSV